MTSENHMMWKVRNYGHLCTKLHQTTLIEQQIRSSHVFTKDLLLYSTEIEVYDASIKRNPVKYQEQDQLRRSYLNEIWRKSIENDENTNFSVALPYLYKNVLALAMKDTLSAEEVEILEPGQEIEEKDPVYPYNLFQEILMDRYTPKLESGPLTNDDGKGRRIRRKRKSKNDTSNFESYSQNLDEDHSKALLSQDYYFRFGTANTEIKPSEVPCGSCGALLHCNDSKMPGYVPSEIFRGKSNEQLRSVICMRCHVMKEYKIALKMSISPDDYVQTLKHLHNKRAIVLIIVDLLDYPGSLWPEILNILGPNKRIILVGNKIDMIPQDSANYLKRIEKSMRETFLKLCNNSLIVHKPENILSMLVSARTGYQIEELVSRIFSSWKEKNTYIGSDVYLIGTTNVGKSSIFNRLLESDLCKIAAINQVEKAMTSPVPGTTLNLLKFPLMRPDPTRLYKRNERVKNSQKVVQVQNLKRIELLRRTKDRKYAMLPGIVEQTFLKKDDKQLPLTGDLFSLNPIEIPQLPKRLDPTNQMFKGYWCYDTPGTVSKNQIINLLTQEEIKYMLPDLPLIPRCFTMKNAQSLFIGGLARFDMLDGPHVRHPIVVTVFCSDLLPINIVRTEDADRFYQSTFGTDIQKVPFGSKKRLDDFPALEGTEYEIDGISLQQSSCDVVLSSIGWISCAPSTGQILSIKAWTPGGKGLYLRDPAFLPFAHHLRGKRISGTCAFNGSRIFIPSKDYQG